MGLRPLADDFVALFSRAGLPMALAPLHSAFKLFKLLDDGADKLLHIREGVTAGNQTEVELIQIADQRDVQRKSMPDRRNRINVEHLGAYT